MSPIQVWRVRRSWLALSVVLALPFLAAAPASAGQVVEVGMNAGSYGSDTIDIEAGDMVVWRNTDGRAHTVTSAWDDGATFNEVLSPGEEFVIQFDGPGEYVIRCVPHSAHADHGDGFIGMVSTVRVAGAPAAQAGDDSASAWARAPLFAFAGAAALLATLGAVGFTSGVLRPRRTPRS